MAALLPSQRQVPVFVGPHGAMSDLGKPTKEEDSSSDDDNLGAEPAMATRWVKMRQQRKMLQADETTATELRVRAAADAFRESARSAGQGVSSTRVDDVTVRLQHAVSIAVDSTQTPSLTDRLDEQMQHEVLCFLAAGSSDVHGDSLAPFEASFAAPQVCKLWNNLLSSNDELWRQLCRTASAPMQPLSARITNAGTLGRSWQEVARGAWAEAAALRSRWRGGICAEQVLRTLHSDYIMAMVMHEGWLVTASADHTIGLTPAAAVRRHALGDSHSSSGVRDPVDDRDEGTQILAASSQASLIRPSSSAVQHEPATGPPAAPRTRELFGHRGQVMSVDARADHIASASADGSVLIWSLAGLGSWIQPDET